MVFWYPKDFLSSIISIFCSVIGILGFYSLFNGEPVAGVACIAVFALGMFLSSRLHTYRMNKKAQKALEKAGLNQPKPAEAAPKAEPARVSAAILAEQEPPAKEPRYCPKCGAALTAGARFCSSCGAAAGTEKSAAPTAEALLAQVYALEQKGDYQGALKLLNDAHAAESGNAILLSRMGRVYRNLGDWQTAISYYEKAAAITPGDPILYSNMGVAYSAAGLYGRAEPLFEKAQQMVERDPSLATGYDRAALLANYALCVGKQGDLKRAGEYLSRAAHMGYAQEKVTYISQQIGL